MSDVVTWVVSHPELIFLFFPLWLGIIALGCWRACHDQKKPEANPINMDENEYVRFNNERFRR
jgi:hypothetical protein